MKESGLRVTQLSAGYGEVTVLRDVSLEAGVGMITAVIGSNGAGKTTLLRALSAQVKLTSGSIEIGGTLLQGERPLNFVAAGIAHVPEGRRLFAGMTVEDNLLMGAFLRRASAAELAVDLARVYDHFPKLAERRRQEAVSMSGGEQQMCAIGRGLMSRPKILMIDELSLGLAPVAVDVLVTALRSLAAEGIGILVVEQDVAVALELAEHTIVLDRGSISRAGPSADLVADPAIRAAYLGA